MFNAPYMIMQIPDIRKIYEINEGQGEDLDLAVETVDAGLFVTTMPEEVLKDWETIYHLHPGDSDSLYDRRLRVQSKMLERLPYSYRVVMRKLDSLLPYGYEVYINENLTLFSVKIVLVSKNMITDVKSFLEEVIPLNMALIVDLKYNTHSVLSRFTHEHLANYTHQQLVDEPLS